MIYLILKALLTGAVVVAISEISKRSSLFAAVLASLPLTSLLAFVWMYAEGRGTSETVEEIRKLSVGIFWMVLPSLFFFVCFPLLLKWGMRFPWALGLSMVTMSIFYAIYVKILNSYGVQL